jgi:hypothetical protein
MTQPDPNPIYTALERELRSSGPDGLDEWATEPAEEPEQPVPS